MAIKRIVNLGLFLAFPLACFLIRDHKEAHNAVIKASPYVRMSLEYIMIYLFAFRGASLHPGWKSQVKGSIKYFLAAVCMIVIKHLIAFNTINEVQQFFVTGKVVQVFAIKDLIEIVGSYALMMIGYAKLAKLPFFLTAHLWVIYYVNSYIFYQEVVDNYSRFKDGFVIIHDATIGSMRKFVKVTHEPPMALALAGLLTLNLEIELLLVSVFNHLFAIVAGYWAISNHTHPYVQALTKHLSPYVNFRTNQLQHDIAFFAICAILSVQVHYWWTISKFLSRFTGRRNTFAIDPWTVRKVRSWKDKVHDIYDYVKEGVYHVYDEAVDGAQTAYGFGVDKSKVALKVGKESASQAFEGAKHVYQEASKNAHCAKKK